MQHNTTGQARPFTLSDFDFALPPELIAQHPAAQRSDSRLLDGSHSTPADRTFTDLPSLLRAGDLMIFNDTRVMNARLFGQKPTGGKVEMLIERVLADNQVAAHLRVSKKPAIGSTFALSAAPGYTDQPRATLLGRWPDADGAMFRLALSNNAADDPYALMARHGHVPLPPYITHADCLEDAQRYQTVFASQLGAVAAPTAALHFDQALLAKIDTMGVQRAYVTLHVGAGTFQPVKTEDLSQHRMHSEWYQIPSATQQAIIDCRARGGRVVAVGTTSVRTLESWALECEIDGVRSPNGFNGVRSPNAQRSCALTPLNPLAPFSRDTRIFITPGFEFQVVDTLITNFHLPKSSLMMLVSAFAGYQRIRSLYQHAMAQRYRFFSYGDAMLLQRLRQPSTDA